jgi:hypothetical protein
MQPRQKLVAAVLAAAMLAAGAPVAQAAIAPIAGSGLLGLGTPAAGNVAATACGPAHGAELQGGTAGSQANACMGSGLVFFGPTSTVNSVVGPTIISPGFAGVVIVSNGPAAFGP